MTHQSDPIVGTSPPRLEICSHAVVPMRVSMQVLAGLRDEGELLAIEGAQHRKVASVEGADRACLVPVGKHDE